MKVGDVQTVTFNVAGVSEFDGKHGPRLKLRAHIKDYRVDVWMNRPADTGGMEVWRYFKDNSPITARVKYTKNYTYNDGNTVPQLGVEKNEWSFGTELKATQPAEPTFEPVAQATRPRPATNGQTDVASLVAQLEALKAELEEAKAATPSADDDDDELPF